MSAASGPSWTPPAGAVTTLILVRHGSTVHSHEFRFSGHNDLPLDDAGQAQAAALAARDFGAVDAVVTSPIRRARETAEAIAAARGLTVGVANDFAELDFGGFEGLTMAEARERFPDDIAAWTGSPAVPTPGGESFVQLDERVGRARDALVAGAARTVVLVSHVSPIKLLVCAAVGAPIRSVYRMHLDTASVSVVTYGSSGASLRLFNDTSHLR